MIMKSLVIKNAGMITLLIVAEVATCAALTFHKGPEHSPTFPPRVGGGYGCAVCTVVVSLVEQLTEVNNQTVIETLDRICFMLPAGLQQSCQLIAEALGPRVIDMLIDKASADDVCYGLKFCYEDHGQTCKLYHKKSKLDPVWLQHHIKKTHVHLIEKWGLSTTWNICEIPGVNILCSLFDKAFNKHLPSEDQDGDFHSTSDTLRGTMWRGRDCDDSRKDIQPGRIPELENDRFFDSNCNGIWGRNNVSMKPYEEELCSGSGQIGVAVFGDSVGAHFHAPQEWFDPLLLTKESLSPLLFALENELDWPQLSLVTGFMDSVWDVTKGPTDSIYKRIVQRNKCNHRDYHNLAVNGDDSFEVLTTVKTFARDAKMSYPMLVFLELVGNDVCNHYPDTLENMTTVDQMYNNLVIFFNELNTTVPAGSQVLIVGMADGDYLYQFLQNRTHPFGQWRNDLKYPDVYDWWNCLQVTPCYGWLNANDTIRRLTTERAANLSLVMKDLADKYKHHWHNLELNYMDNPISDVIRRYLFEHGPDSGWQLIEPVDGFHPNQLGQALSAAAVWNYMEDNLPHYLGPLNEKNDQIQKIFGDQGGY